MNTILTDDEIEDAWCKYGDEMGGADQSDALRIGREIEAAVLAKLREQEPVAYGMPDTQLGRKHRLMMVRLDKGQDGCTLPLYAAPLPAVVQVPQEFTATADNDFAYGYQDGWNACRKAMLAAAPEATAQAEHITDGTPCWCDPELNYKDPETGAEVWVHRGKQ